MMAAILIICGSIVLLTACSENDDPVSGNESGDGSVDATGQVVMMYYGIGGANLDAGTEAGLGTFAIQQMSGTGVRSFVQFKYSVHHLALPRAKREITFFIPPLQIRLKIVTFASASK